ncbi:MAG: tRNA pseudouridine(38-40) synthase TruA [Lachnospiraceae bacterium]|nr:tRNA pseudouridine(38-40) synthase TruA [Lachnospiraceae bacterium]
MRRIKLTIAYDGTRYVGWQMQPNGVAVETVVNAALKKLLKEDVSVIGASRTDSGVHADGNVCVFDTSSRIPAEKFTYALNEFLPPDVKVQASEETALTYHPRKVNSVKTYEYRILNRKIPLPKARDFSCFYYYDLDVPKMDRAVKVLVGEHDFRSFCSIRTSVEDTVRRICNAEVKREGDYVVLRISGSGFLYNMVRIIAGTLIKIGGNIIPEDSIGRILEARDRSFAGPMAPAEGLTLVSIEEEKILPDTETEDNSHWGYEIDYRFLPDGKIRITHSDERDYEALLLRLTKRVSRNGAVFIDVSDDTGNLFDGRKADYFTFHAVEGEPGVFRTADPRKLTGEPVPEPEEFS